MAKLKSSRRRHCVRHVAANACRLGFARCRQHRMAFLALLLRLFRRSQAMHSMAGGTVGGLHLRPRHHESGMFGGEIVLLLCGMACATKRGHLVRRGNPIRRCRSRGSSMLHALPVTGIAAQSFGEMRMCLKIRHLLGMARRAIFMRLLRRQRQRTKQKQQILHPRFTKLRSIDASAGLPASAIASFSSAPSIQSTRSTPGCPNAPNPHSGGRPTRIAFAP